MVQRIGFGVGMESGEESEDSQLRSLVWNMLIIGRMGRVSGLCYDARTDFSATCRDVSAISTPARLPPGPAAVSSSSTNLRVASWFRSHMIKVSDSGILARRFCAIG